MRELERDLPADAALAAAPPPIARLVVVGRGRAGGAIACAAQRVGLRTRLAGRDDAVDACQDGDVALLCVPDEAIAATCEWLSPAIPPLRFVGHVSGATTLDALDAARTAGAEAFSIHPLQTIPTPDPELVGAPCAVAGSGPEALALAHGLAHRLEMRPFEVPEEARAAYHAAAAIASNLLVALEESAAELLEHAGVEGPPRELLAPLVLRTAANWAERGPDALTGPIARGDGATVERHVEALRELAPEIVASYEALSERARALASGGEARA